MKSDLELLQEASLIGRRYDERAEVKDAELDNHLQQLIHKTITKDEANVWMKSFLDGEVRQLSEYISKLSDIQNQIVDKDNKRAVEILGEGILKQKQDREEDLAFFHEVTKNKYREV